MIRTLCLGLVATSFFATPAFAETRSEQVASCMIRNATETDISQMKQLMLLALQEKKSEATGVLGSLMLTAGLSASSNCGVGFNEVGTPMFEYALRLYGEHLGTVVMERSLDFMELPMQ
jgi:ribonucleotide reductase alpha subunit